ncbi:MAG: hypothetical protein EBQ95_02360 [Gammaproteobacteria bacterium]|nr:hypothetical protein [Gammaproteobacteria bacterium]
MTKKMHRMQNQSIINLKIKPTRQPLSLQPTEISIGDLHANIVKLIYTLVSVGVFDITTNGYYNLIKIYQKRHLNGRDLQLYQNIIENELSNFNSNITVRFLGDTMSDRGQNDILFLKFLRILAFNRINYRIIFSNHDAEILRIILKYSDISPPPIINTLFDDVLGASFHKMMYSVNHHYISWFEIQILYHHYYLPALTLIDFSLGNNDNIFIYTHAPTSLRHIESLSKELNTTFLCTDYQVLFKTLENLNEVFQNLIISEDIISHLEPSKALFSFIWRREHQTYSIYQIKETLKITYVYGHDNPDDFDKMYTRPKNVIRLDNLLGKQGLTNPENLRLEESCFISKHLTYPLTRVNPSIPRKKPIEKEFPWQQWIKLGIAHQIFINLDPNHELSLAHNQLPLVLHHLRLHPNITDETLNNILVSLEQPELHSDFLLIRDNVFQLSEFKILTDAIQIHLNQLDLQHKGFCRQKKEIEEYLKQYQNGIITSQIFLIKTKLSIEKINRLNSHQANWIKILLNTFLTTALTTVIIFCSFQTSATIFSSLLLSLIIAQLSQIIQSIHVPLNYEIQNHKLSFLLTKD